MNIRGKVVDEGNHPVAGAKVGIFEAGLEIAGATTGPHGGFEIGVGGTAQQCRVRASKTGFITIEKDLGLNPSAEVVLTLRPDPGDSKDDTKARSAIRLSGRVLDPRGQPIPGAKIRILDGQTEVGGVTSGEDGGFEFSSQAEGAHHKWKLIVSKQGFLPLSRELDSGINPSLGLVIRPVPRPIWERIKEWWQERSLLVRAALGAGLLALIAVILVWAFWPKPSLNSHDDSSHPHDHFVHLKLTSRETNVVLIFTNHGVVREVDVRLDEGRESKGETQKFLNPDREAADFVVPPLTTFHRVLAITTWINGLKEEPHVFMSAKEADARDAATHVYDALIAMARIGVNMSALNGNDETLKTIATRQFDYWNKDYLNHLQSLAELSVRADSLKQALELFHPNGPYSSAEIGAHELMLPVLADQYQSFLANSAPPSEYMNAIFSAYQKDTNSIVHMLDLETARQKARKK